MSHSEEEIDLMMNWYEESEAGSPDDAEDPVAVNLLNLGHN